MKITIPKPCHENWEAMNPDEKGRFCSVCSKTVLDFTGSSDEEIINSFKNLKEDICGNFNKSQLNRNLHYSYINLVFVKFAVGFILTTGGLVSLNAQQKKDTLKAEEIQEVVIMTGLTRKKVETVTGGASTVISEEKLNKLQEGAVKSLEGKIGGVVVNSTHKNASTNNKIRIGGVRSLPENQKPICVLDEKIITLEEFTKIDPQSIETMNVLKDARARVLYGEDGKNGVIFVTTKKKK